MKFIPAILALFLTTTGCSYVSDSIEGAITDRSSFSVNAEYNGVNTVTLTWDHTDSSDNFAGIEIYRTKYPNDEYSEYILIRSTYEDSSHNTSGGDISLANGSTTTYSDSDLPSSYGIYFYRVGFVHWDEDPSDRTSENGYTGDTETDYYNNTDIDSISGYARVLID